MRLREAFVARELLLTEKSLQERLTAERSLVGDAVLKEEGVLSQVSLS